MVFDLNTLLPMLPELTILGSAILLLMIGAFFKDKAFTFISVLSSLSLIAAAVLIGDKFDAATFRLFDGLFISNTFIAGLKIIILIAAVLGIKLSLLGTQQVIMRRFEYPVLILFSVLGMMLMLSSGNFMTFYLGLEMQSLALYVLVAFDRDTVKSSEAGLKYFVLGALSSGFLLFGMSMIYGVLGSLDYQYVFLALEGITTKDPYAAITNIGLLFGLILILVGLAFKLSAVPFHMWTPDVYEGAPLQVTGLMAIAPFKITALGVLVMILFLPFGLMIQQWQQVIILISVLSMIVGAVAALRQNNIKRLLGYSSIAHVGYLLIAVAIHSGEGIRGLLFYVMLYVLMNAGAFAALLTLDRKGKTIEEIDELKGLGKDHPFAALVLAAMMFSMAGIPPLAGFWGKFYIFSAAIKGGFVWLAIVGVLSSLVAAYYYLRVVKVMYFEQVKSDVKYRPSFLSRVMMAGLLGLNLALFIYPNPLLQLATRIIGGLF